MDIKITRDQLFNGTGRLRPFSWIYSWQTPADIDWPNGDGTSRPGPRAGDFVEHGTGQVTLRDWLRKRFGRDIVIVETWKLVVREHQIGCGNCQDTHPAVADVIACHTEDRGGYLDGRDFAAEQRAEIDAENAWLGAAEAGNPETWYEENLARQAEAYACPVPAGLY